MRLGFRHVRERAFLLAEGRLLGGANLFPSSSASCRVGSQIKGASAASLGKVPGRLCTQPKLLQPRLGDLCHREAVAAARRLDEAADVSAGIVYLFLA